MIKQAPNGALITVHIVPGSSKFCVAGEDEWTRETKIKVKSKAMDGKANRELVSELEKLLSAKVKIITGHKARHKVLLAESDANSVGNLLK